MSSTSHSPAILGDVQLASIKDDEGSHNTVTVVSGVSEPSGTNLNGSAQPSAPLRPSTSRLSRTSTPQTVKDKEPRSLARVPSTASSPNVALDPLSTQIYLRSNVNTEPTIAQRLLHSARADSPTRDNQRRQSIDIQGKVPNGSLDASRDKRKGSSFLSRLAMRGAWKKDDDMNDSDSELGELRTDGSNARAMTSVIGACGGYTPLHKEPPRYIRVKTHYKKTRDFNHIFLAQELLGAKRASEDEPRGREPATAIGSKLMKSGDAIWAAEFSLDGRYLAVAGKDQTVRVFSVISTPEERRAHEEEEESRGRADGEKLSAPVFRSKPAREFEGHTGEVLALSWSKNNFLLSSSMDKTVRLWHMSRPECLCSFKHNDLVTSIAFHPTDDRFFLAGSLDAQLRLWSIPDKAVAFSAGANEFITAVAFSPDGKTAICGLLSGLCLFYDTEELKLRSQIHVRSSRGKNAKGSKITGIRTALAPGETGNDDVKVLISSNDSRVRIYSLRTKMLEVKFRGLENQSSQIHARFSDDGAYVISGSEDRQAYIWSSTQRETEMKDKQPYEYFDAHPEVVTTALMAPTNTRLLLSASGDPVYELCNPPPVMLLSLGETNTSQSKLSEGGVTESVVSLRKPEETPAYIERSKHLDGNIIITTDRTGIIKVFRQDCAFSKRQQSLWETASKFSGRRAGGIRRSGSITTRASTSSRVHSRRGSLNLGAASQQTQPPSDRIMSWRQDVEGRTQANVAASKRERSPSSATSARTPPGSSAANLSAEVRKQPYNSNRTNHPISPTSSVYTRRSSLRATNDKDLGSSMPPTPSFSLVSASESNLPEDKGEGSFWNLSRWKGSLPGLKYTLSGSPLSSGTNGVTKSISKDGNDDATALDEQPTRETPAIEEVPQPTTAASSIRRRSGGAVQVPGPEAIREATKLKPSDTKEIDSADEPQLDKKRTDSGVAEVSADSTDDSDTATCRNCGGRSFMAKRVANGKAVLSCQNCGTLS